MPTELVPIGSLSHLIQDVTLPDDDIARIQDSLIKHGWRDPLKAEGESVEGDGGLRLKYGQGRVAALAELKRHHQSNPELFPVPDGVEVEDGEWFIPIEVSPAQIEIQ